ncbi:MAG TPA: hypothetical protein PKZ97_12550 [Azospirillaceae bacterium]|nr:hypothetical protein [Azospirillaceae bacterium]HRQ81937.1 hypothetical protein [Azospirillaceae bacterium]
MVAYTYKSQFVAPTLERIKIGTIRAEGKKRHARPGEALQHYTGSRFRPRLFARSVCMSVDHIRLFIRSGFVEVGDEDSGIYCIEGAALDAFAVGDGFADWKDMTGFWRQTYDWGDRLFAFRGIWIRWKPETLVTP